MNPYGADISDKNIIGPLARLKIIYDEMPKTTGCEECSKIYGEKNKDWCCKSISPSMHYVEFLYVWQDVQKWSKKKKLEVIIRCIRNYLSNRLDKGCVFYKEGCTIYNLRPTVCRHYGITCPSVFEERYNRLKERQGDKCVVKPQCNKVSIKDENYKSEFILPEDENQWFKQVIECENRIGVSPEAISMHDLPGGSYRTFHDHILIELFEPSFLEMLTKYRFSHPSEEDIDKTIEVLKNKLEEIL